MIGILLWLTLAQTFIIPGEPVIITLAGDARPVDLLYHSAGGERITVTARSLAAEPIDGILEILLDERRIAFNDDHRSDFPDLAERDAAIFDLAMPSAGVLTIRVNSFSGAQAGDVEVVLSAQRIVQECSMPMTDGMLRANDRFGCTIRLDAGQTVTLIARDTSGTLDPALALRAESGQQIAFNDDHDTYDLSLNTLDAKIDAASIQNTGIYTIEVTDFSGMAGRFKLTITITP